MIYRLLAWSCYALPFIGIGLVLMYAYGLTETALMMALALAGGGIIIGCVRLGILFEDIAKRH
jgi:hypothetical protein